MTFNVPASAIPENASWAAPHPALDGGLSTNGDPSIFRLTGYDPEAFEATPDLEFALDNMTFDASIFDGFDFEAPLPLDAFDYPMPSPNDPEPSPINISDISSDSEDYTSASTDSSDSESPASSDASAPSPPLAVPSPTQHVDRSAQVN